MRVIQAEAAALPREGGGFMLRLKSVTGETLGVELSPERAAALREQLAAAKPLPAETPAAARIPPAAAPPVATGATKAPPTAPTAKPAAAKAAAKPGG